MAVSEKIVRFKDARDWLNESQGKETYLSPLIRELVQQLDGAIGVKDFVVARGFVQNMIDVIEYAPVDRDSMEIAEVYVECGNAFLEMGDVIAARKWLKKAVQQYYVNDHNRAVARWMLGNLLFLPPHSFSDALANWDLSWKAFNDLSQHTGISKEGSEWYRDRSAEMFESIRAAVRAIRERPKVLQP